LAALIFAFDSDQVVLAHIRDRGWCIPGGRLDPGETADDAVRREAREEAGIEVGELQMLGTTVELVRGENEFPVAISFAARVESFGDIPAGSESTGIRLVTRAEAPSLYYLWDALMEAMFDYAWARHRDS